MLTTVGVTPQKIHIGRSSCIRIGAYVGFVPGISSWGRQFRIYSLVRKRGGDGARCLRGLRLRSFQSWPCKHETNVLLLLFLLLSCRLNTTPPFFFWLVFPEYWLPVNLILFKITYIVIVCDPYRSLIIGEALSERIKKKKCHRRRSGQYTLQCFVLFFFLHLSDTVAAYNLSYTSGEIC